MDEYEYESEARSVFVVVHNFYGDTHLSIIQLEKPEEEEEEEQIGIGGNLVDDLKLRFFERIDLPEVRWSVTPPTISTGDFYLLPSMRAAKPLCGYQFNFGTASFQNICLPPSIQEGMPESLVNLNGCIYRMELQFLQDHSAFDCYDPKIKSWKSLKPLPLPLSFVRFDPRVYATAVWGCDTTPTILYNVASRGIWAYDVAGNEWYQVAVDDRRWCCSILGEAVVVKGTIYALTKIRDDVVLALSIERGEGSGGDLVFQCCLRSVILMPFRSREPDSPVPALVRSTHLLHLGNTDFCLVECCDPLVFEGPTPIHVTYMRLPEETEETTTGLGLARETKMTVLSNHWFENRYNEITEVVTCFSLPKCKTTALEQGKQLAFELNPFIAHPIYVRDLRDDVTVSQLEKGLDVFGSIKRNGIQVKTSKEGKYFAIVEFESFSSKQRAIAASTVRIGACPAKISEN